MGTGIGWLQGRIEDWLPFLDSERGYRYLNSGLAKRRIIEQRVEHKCRDYSKKEQYLRVEEIIENHEKKERIACELADYGSSREEILRKLKIDVLGKGY